MATPGVGLAFLDPHGSAAEELLEYVPPSRTGDVVYFDPEDTDFPIGFNLLDSHGGLDEHQIVSETVSIFKRFWGSSIMARSEDLLANTLAALVEHGDQTLLGALRMLTDEAFRARILRKVSNPVVLRFWHEEFDRYDARYREQVAAPILNKLRRFLADAPMRNILGQVRSGFDLGEVMNEGKILFARLPASLGESNADLLGSMLVTKIYLSALQRSRVPEGARRDFFLVLDEFQRFSTDTFASILAEARKHHLSITLANQHLAQISEDVTAAVLGNAGTLIAFGLGAEDAQRLAPSFLPFSAQTLRDLGRGEIAIRLLVDGETAQPFLATTTVPDRTHHHGRSHLIRQQSRRHYASDRAAVEKKLAGWYKERA